MTLRVTSTQIRPKNAKTAEYVLWCEIEHYLGELRL